MFPGNTGITPARAGKTHNLSRLCPGTQDHPRSCGKDHTLPLLRYSFLGSPPLVRERPFFSLPGFAEFGITPARAGKTRSKYAFHAGFWDHPRSCGKDVPCIGWDRLYIGSPPLVRERQIDFLTNAWEARITPARAGKTFLVCHISSCSWDHPRSCGKDDAAAEEDVSWPGSPPLVRERRVKVIRRFTCRGITPARAGKTVMDPLILAIFCLPVFKIYLTSLQDI